MKLEITNLTFVQIRTDRKQTNMKLMRMTQKQVLKDKTKYDDTKKQNKYPNMMII